MSPIFIPGFFSPKQYHPRSIGALITLGSISSALSGPRASGVSAGSFPETAAGNRAYDNTNKNKTVQL